MNHQDTPSSSFWFSSVHLPALIKRIRYMLSWESHQNDELSFRWIMPTPQQKFSRILHIIISSLAGGMDINFSNAPAHFGETAKHG
jgi:hypothetical protein